MVNQPPPPPPAGAPSAAAKTVKMEAIKAGSIDGFPFDVGDTIDVEESQVDSLQAQGLAVRADRVEVAQKDRQAREAAQKTAKEERKNPVTPRGR